MEDEKKSQWMIRKKAESNLVSRNIALVAATSSDEAMSLFVACQHPEEIAAFGELETISLSHSR